MCLIVDANKVGEFFGEPPSEEAAPIREWLENRDGKLVYCDVGKYAQELKEHNEKLRNLYRNGQADLIEIGISEEQEKLEKLNICTSDDIHILALARVGGARLLYTGDKALIKDFTNKAIIDDPRGKIYSGAKNKRLLKRGVCK